jgi:hypothetical protein
VPDATDATPETITTGTTYLCQRSVPPHQFKSAYAGQSRPAGITVTNWIDETQLQPFAISVKDGVNPGELVTYLPLTTVPDASGGGDVAFGAQINALSAHPRDKRNRRLGECPSVPLGMAGGGDD